MYFRGRFFSSSHRCKSLRYFFGHIYFCYSKGMTKNRGNYIIFVFIFIRYSLTSHEIQKEEIPFRRTMPDHNVVFESMLTVSMFLRIKHQFFFLAGSLLKSKFGFKASPWSNDVFLNDLHNIITSYCPAYPPRLPLVQGFSTWADFYLTHPQGHWQYLQVFLVIKTWKGE